MQKANRRRSRSRLSLRRRSTWQPRNAIANTLLKTSTETHRGTKVNIEKTVKAPVVQFESLVNALDVSGDVWVAATNYGLLTSHDQGATLAGRPGHGRRQLTSLSPRTATTWSRRATTVS